MSDTQNVYTLFRYVNNVGSSLFAPMMLLVIWVILFIGIIVTDRKACIAWVYSSFVCSILAILLVLINVLAKEYMYFLFMMVAVGAVWTKLTGDRANV